MQLPSANIDHLSLVTWTAPLLARLGALLWLLVSDGLAFLEPSLRLFTSEGLVCLMGMDWDCCCCWDAERVGLALLLARLPDEVAGFCTRLQHTLHEDGLVAGQASKSSQKGRGDVEVSEERWQRSI